MKLNTILILILLLQLPTFFEGAIYMIIPILIGMLLFYKYSVSRNNALFKNILFSDVLIWLYALTITISVFRSNNIDYTGSFLMTRIVGFIFLITGAFSLITYFVKKFPGYLIVLYLILVPFLLWAAVNFLLWFLDINLRQSVLSDNEEAEGVILSLLGISTGRVQFPMAGGLNNYSAILGALLTLVLIYIFILKKKIVLNIQIGIFLLISILLIDSRVAIILPIMITGVLYFLYKRKRITILKWTPLIVILGPLLVMLILPLLAQTGFAESLSRSSGDIASGNSRFLIWGIAFNSFMDFEPIHLIGFGEFGHFGSGTSKLWSFLFNSWENSEMKSPHNSMLSMLFDVGYLGLIIYLLLLMKFFNRVISTWEIRKDSCILYIAFMLYNMLAGITETLTGFYSANFLIMFFLIIICEFSEYKFINKQLKQ